MRNGSILHPIARSLLAVATSVVLVASPALADGPSGDTGAASPTAEVSSTPSVDSPPSPTDDDRSATSPTPSSGPSPDGASPIPAEPLASASATEGARGAPETRVGRDLAKAAGFASVAARDNRFVPVGITVQAGTTVVWENEGQAPHTVTASDRVFDSGTLDPGQRFQITFDEVGTVPYYCQIHGEPGSGMTGLVRVVAAETPDEPGAAVADPNELPRTGSAVAWLALLALALTVTGAFALRAGVRRGRG